MRVTLRPHWNVTGHGSWCCLNWRKAVGAVTVKSQEVLIRAPRFRCSSIQAFFCPPTCCQPSEQSYRWYWFLVVSNEGIQNRTNTYQGQGILPGTPHYNIYNRPNNGTNGKIFHQLKVSFHSGCCPKWFTSAAAFHPDNLGKVLLPHLGVPVSAMGLHSKCFYLLSYPACLPL